MNKAIAEKLGLLYEYENGKADGSSLDYCNNWNDLMPLVIEHKICLSNLYDQTDWAGIYFDEKGYQRIVVISKIPKRALAECLLKVLTNK